MTVHELANLSGVSIRALHYYDKIGLLCPCRIEQNGYRKYNEESLKRLQQILFYKEMDLPLKQIKTIMKQPGFDQKAAIRDQKDLLLAKRNRFTKLIELMDRILEGNEVMDFSIFEHNELEEVFRNRMLQMDPEYQQSIIHQFGSIDACIENMLSNEANIKELATKFFGNLDNYIESLKKEPLSKEGTGKLQLALDQIIWKIVAHKEEDIHSPQIQELVDEWKSIASQLFQMEDITETFRLIYQGYQNSEEVIKAMDDIYGEGSIVFVGKAMEYNDTKKKH